MSDGSDFPFPLVTLLSVAVIVRSGWGAADFDGGGCLAVEEMLSGPP